MRITISLGQMDVLSGEPEHNLARVRDWIGEAAQRGSDLVVFPELWDTGYALERADELGTRINEGRFVTIANLAKKHQIHIAGSMMEIESQPNKPSCCAYNTLAWFGPDGTVIGAYRKMHLFRLMNEDQHLCHGREPVTLSLPWGKTGLAICYDLRFPELFRGYALDGALMNVIPAQWPHPRMEHWRTLLQARAIENQVFVVACNRVGQENEARFGGASAIYDPWGEVIVEGGEEEILLTASIDLDAVAQARKNIPVFEDRRPDIYGR